MIKLIVLFLMSLNQFDSDAFERQAALSGISVDYKYDQKKNVLSIHADDNRTAVMAIIIANDYLNTSDDTKFLIFVDDEEIYLEEGDAGAYAKRVFK